MNQFKRNLKLFAADVVDPVKRLRKEGEKELWFKQNRREVLLLYRHMLKKFPSLHENLFERQFLYEEIKFNFHEGRRETDPETICYLKNACYLAIEKTNKGVYPPFPKYVA